MTVTDAITSALSRIGVVPIGGAIPAEFSTIAITELNAMLQHWAAVNILSTKITKVTAALTAGTSIYTVGSGEAISVTRPTAIRAASVTLNSVETPCDVYRGLEGYATRPKGLRGRPSEVHYDAGVTQGAMGLHPIPDGAYTLALWTVSGIAVVTAGGDTIAVPAEFDHVVKVALAAHLMSMWGKDDPFLAKEATLALEAVTPRGTPVAVAQQGA